MVKLINILATFLLFFLLSVSAKAQFKADFTVKPSKGCSPVTVDFTDASTGAVSYFWDFGNGNTSTKQNPKAIFIKPGLYTIKLTVKDKNGNSTFEEKVNHIQVFKNPTASLNSDKQVACIGDSISFTDLSIIGDAAITSWKWDFGDGTLAYTKNASHSYSQSGKYTIRLVVEDANGCENSVSFNSYITINPEPNSGFAIGQDYHCNFPHNTTFKAAGGSNLSYIWDFDDGGSGSGENTNHTFNSKGTFQVKLSATDGNGCKSNTTIPVTVDDLKVDFISQRSTVCLGEYLQLVPNLKPNINGATFEWDMGDGTKINTRNVAYKYKNVGNYTINLIVIAAGCTAKISKANFALVKDIPKIKTVFSDSVLCSLKDKITFSETNTKNVSWVWSFSDGNEITNKSGVLGFKIAGNLSYKLKVKDKDGCENEESGHVKISDLIANYTSSLSAFDSLASSFGMRPIYGGCKPLVLELKENVYTSFGIKNISWNMGIGPNQLGKSANITYDSSKFRYHGFLYVEDKLGCKDTTDFYVQEGFRVYPNFTPNSGEWCNGDTIYFDNLTTPTDSIDRFSWSFGSSDFEPKYVIDREPDTTIIRLDAYVNGCKSDTSLGDFAVLGSFGRIKTKAELKCFIDSAKFIAECIECDSIAWYLDNKFYSNEDSIKLASSQANVIKLHYWNFNSKCDHFKEVTFDPPSNPQIVVNWPVIDSCAPVISDFSASGNNVASYMWYINGEDSIASQSMSYEFKQAGTYKIDVTIRTFDSCFYYYSKSYDISGIRLPSNIIQKDTCLPFNIELQDSNFVGRNGESVYWIINDKDTFYHTKFSSTYSITEPYKDGLVLIKIVGEDKGGCSSEREFKLPASSPYAAISEVLDFRCDHIYSKFDVVNKHGNIVLQNWYLNGKRVGVFDRLQVNLPYDIKNTLKLRLVDNNGCAAEITKNYEYIKTLKANLTADTTGSFCPPLEVRFKDLTTSDRPIISYEWDFGDGSSSELQNPKKIYLNPGRYGIKLKVKNSIGCTDTAFFPDFIIVNGPHGTYDFGPNNGCIPLKVDFTSTTFNAQKIKWDIGDGVTLDGKTQTYTYNRPGAFIPVLILEDSLGCKHSILPIDTINVYENPEVNYEHTNPCFGEEVKLKSLSIDADGISKHRWSFDDGTEKNGVEIGKNFTKDKTQKVKLSVENIHGCTDSMVQNIKLYEPIAKFNLNDTQFCIGQTLQTFNKSTADTNIVSFNWDIQNIDSSKLFEPSFLLEKLGNFEIKLIVEDAAGCFDTLIRPKAFGVGDTFAPAPPFIHRVNVLNDNAIDVTFNKDSIADFFRYELFRDIGSNSFIKVGEGLKQKDTLVIDNNVHTLHTPHCYVINKENYCNVKTDLSLLKKHCTVEATATGIINAIKIDWNHYFGWNEIDSYYVFRQEKNIPDSFTFIGSVDGNTLEFIDTAIYCRDEEFYKILAKQKTQINTQWSWSDSTGASPIYMNEVPPNEIWRVSVEEDDFNVLEWLPVKGSKFPIAYYKLFIKESNNNYQLIWDSISPNITALEYHDTEVDDYNYFYKMQAVDVCDDISDFSRESKTILLKAEMNGDFRPKLNWTKYKGWTEGVEEYIVEFQNPEDGSFTEIGRTSGLDTTFNDEVSPFNCIEEYCYRITAIRNQPYIYPDSSHDVISHSNIDCAPVVSKLFVPNAFTLNADGLNDNFTIKGIYIKEYNIKIYNRYGEKVYDSNSFKVHWDGKFANESVAQNVFVFLIEAKGVDGKIYRFKGDVTLLR